MVADGAIIILLYLILDRIPSLNRWSSHINLSFVFQVYFDGSHSLSAVWLFVNNGILCVCFQNPSVFIFLKENSHVN